MNLKAIKTAVFRLRFLVFKDGKSGNFVEKALTNGQNVICYCR